MVTRDEVVGALKTCYDPEIPVNVWDLGLIYGIDIDGDKVTVRMTLTAPGCPLAGPLAEEVRTKLLALDGVKDANVVFEWTPPWTPDKMSDEAKANLGIG